MQDLTNAARRGDTQQLRDAMSRICGPAFMAAAAAGHVETLQQLYTWGVPSQTVRGALSAAAGNGHTAAVQCLLGWEADGGVAAAANAAARRGHAACLKALSPRANRRVRTRQLALIQYSASISGKPEALRAVANWEAEASDEDTDEGSE